MSFEVIATTPFQRAAKELSKKHRSLKADLKTFIESLEKNPIQGDELSPSIRKIRMAITSKGKGKSGGARVITYTLFYAATAGKVYLIDIYDKSSYSTVDVNIIKKIISGLDIQ